MPPHGRQRSALTSSPFLSLVVLPFLLFLLSFPGPVAAAGSAVVGIDVGTEYLKAALVKPGIPLEIVLTKDSKRKETATVAFKPTKEHNAPFPERFYGGDALGLAARYPDDVYSNLKTLLGVPFNVDDETIRTYQQRYPALKLEAAPGGRGTVGLRSNRLGEAEKKDAFLVEELLAMQLKQIKGNAESLAGPGSNIRDAVVTYPSFYTVEEKRSLELAAKLAGLNVNGFISEGLAVGLNYATGRTFQSVSEGAKPEYHVVYDMGAGSTTASVVRFQGRTVKDVGKLNKTVQEVQVLGTAWDKTLGGDSLNDLIVKDMVASLVEDQKLKGRVSTEAVLSHGKTMARLWRDAEKARQVLSANTESGASFESLYEEDFTFKYRVSRAKFEQLAAQHVARVGGPLENALVNAGLQLNDIESVILHGGAIRTPFVQKQLERVCGSSNKIRTSVNADEAAVFGAAFKAAALSPSFRVKDIRASEAASHAVLLKWTADGKERQQKLFTPTSQVGAEKQVTLKNLEDFELSFSQLNEFGTEKPVVNVQTQNLTASVTKLKDTFGCTPANMTTSFSIRLSPAHGIPEIVTGSVNCEVESSKGIVDGVKGFFGLGSKKEGQAPLGENGEPSESITLESEEPPSSPTPSASDASSTTASAAAEAKKSATPQTKIESIPISLQSSPLGIPAPSSAELNRITTRLAAFDTSDRNRFQREEALNELESFIYRSRDLVEDDEFIKAIKPDQLSILKELTATTGDWLYDASEDAPTVEFQTRLKTLKDIVLPVQRRRQEGADRPARVELMQTILKDAKTLVGVMDQQIKHDEAVYSSSAAQASSSSTTTTSSPTGESPSSSPDLDDLEQDPFASASASASTKSKTTTAQPKPTGPRYTLFQPADLSTLSTTLESTSSWFETNLDAQSRLTDSDDPALSATELEVRLKELERILTRLHQKLATSSGSGSGSGNGNGKSQSRASKKNDKARKDKETKKEKPTYEPPEKDEL